VLLTLIIVVIYRTLLGIITQQLNKLVANLDKIAKEGDLTIDLSMSTKNELGDISRSVNATILALRDLLRGLGQSILTSSRLSNQLEDSSGEMLDDAGKTQQLSANIASAIEQVASTGQEIAKAAVDTLSASKQLDGLAEQSLIANDKIRHSMEVLSDDIKGVQQNAADMEQQVTEIGSILDTINSLSDQTNLLALNAAIEAARAGEHGRGFAVVADEVRSLASRTQESTTDIRKMVERLQHMAEQTDSVMRTGKGLSQSGVEKTAKVVTSLEQINQAIGTVHEQSTHIAHATEQQTEVAQDIHKSLVAITGLSDRTSQHAEELAVEATQLSGVSTELNDLVGQFKI
jgi:methyl-accepting chemotaxis protein